MKHLCRSKFERNCRSKNLNQDANFELTAIGLTASKRVYDGVNEKEDSIIDENYEAEDLTIKKKNSFKPKSNNNQKIKEKRMTER